MMIVKTVDMPNQNIVLMTDIDKIKDLYSSRFGAFPTGVTPMAGAGSNRRYYRLEGCAGEAVVATCGDDAAENRAFMALSGHLCDNCRLPVPAIMASSEDNTAYLQTWAGEKDLFSTLAHARETGEYSSADISLLDEAMRLLARIQYSGGKDMDFDICYPRREMDRRLVRWDLSYFKYCFLKPSGIEFDEDALQDEFDSLEEVLLSGKEDWSTFMLRDFQSRNVMVGEDGSLTAIDFQGGRRGPGAYDVASFVWQAKARYPEWLKERMTDVYVNEMERLNPAFDSEGFREELPVFVLFRCLQTLGAYGFRGWIERKPHFLQSVPAGVDNLATLLANGKLSETFPHLGQIAIGLKARFGSEAEGKRREKYLHQIPAAENPLTVRVTSFSFKKGLPEDPSGNGGGFVFDCRAPHNPGRYEPYKKLTGLDAPVREFLESDGEIKPFIEECERIVDASVERYLQRGFTNLSVNFGCTGGQHRSVYSADAVARHLNDKYGVKVLLTHREQGIFEELPEKDVAVVFDSFLRDPQKPYEEQL